MASHHQPYHSCHHHPPPTPTSSTTTTSCYCCCYYSSYTPSHHPFLPDPHLPSIVHPTQPRFFSPSTAQIQTQAHNHYHPPQPHPHLQNPRHFQELPINHNEELTNPHVISSLLRRISALEATLKRYYSSSSSSSLRDAAARTIQNHFRSFLVRRSRTLAQLKQLASIKSTLNALKSAISDNAQFDPQAISLKAMDLFLKLDFIQGGDPLIRDGKRSISRELNRLMDFAGGVSMKRNGLSSRMVKNIRCGGDNNKSRDLTLGKKRSNVEAEKLVRRGDAIRKLREQIERINRFSRVSEEEDDDDEEDAELESPAISLVRKSGVSIDKGHGDIVMEKLREQVQRRKGLRTVAEEDAEEDEELESPTLYLVKKNGIPINKCVGLTKGNIGAQAKVKKSVRFVEDRNVYRVLTSNLDPVMNEDCDSVDGSESVDVEGQLIGQLDRKVEEIGFSSKEMGDDHEEAETEDEGSTRSSDGSSDANYNLKSRNDVSRKSYDQVEEGDFTFSAPLPVKMEPRADLTNKRRSLNA